MDSPTDGDSAATDIPVRTCSGANATVENATCHDLVATGPCVEQVQVDDNSPAPSGGSLVEGTYDLSERILYTNPGGATGSTGSLLQETLVLRSLNNEWTMQVVTVAGTIATRKTMKLTLSGSGFRAEITCPSLAPAVDGGPSDGGDEVDAADAEADGESVSLSEGTVGYYTASDEGLTLFGFSAIGPIRVDSYTRRQR